MAGAERRLGDLFKVGEDVTITDGEGEAVTVWVRKVSGPDHDTCVRKARAARARMMRAFEDPDSDESLEIEDQTREWGKETTIEVLLIEKARDAREVIEARLLGDEESRWGKDDYLVGLRDAWLDDPEGGEGLGTRYKKNPEDPEALRVFEALKEFNTEAGGLLDVEVDRCRAEMHELSEQEIRTRGIHQLRDQICAGAWVQEYDRWSVFYGTRQEKAHGTHYFKDIQEVDDLADEAYARLRFKLKELEVDVAAGKDLPDAPTSSQPSGQPEPTAAVQPSSQRAATG